ncbi:hypothetical protein FRC12_011273 [Ceratobasidium sp. 428]|nr:hypothetical protein FRC12_011273 [Ceratobasidium sp. 428]
MSDKIKEHYINVAQQVCDDKLNGVGKIWLKVHNPRLGEGSTGRDQRKGDAAAAAASNGSPPTATNPNAILFVEWKNYHKTVKQYKVVVYNWLMKTSGQMMDPNSMGLGQLQVLLRCI